MHLDNTPSQLFGEGIVCTSKRIAPVTARARTATTLLRIPYTVNQGTCGSHGSNKEKIIYLTQEETLIEGNDAYTYKSSEIKKQIFAG